MASPSNNIGAAEAIDASLYPDLVEAGGLAPLLRQMASTQHTDLGEVEPDTPRGRGLYVTARMTSDRGPVKVLLGLDSRRFSISLGDAETARGWASGSTPDITEAARAIEAWRHGSKLKDMTERFPFVDYPRLSQGYEDGNPVETQWSLLLEDDDFNTYRSLLAALHGDPVISHLFPYFSHWVLRLTKDPFDLDTNQIAISDSPEASRYEVYLLHGGIRITVTADEVVDRVRSLLNSL
ncbi:MAG: hypothetical protein HOW97_08860 [Catenulispora sp.]|nr:hypothetical protein [Catenulispora sp.]